MGIVLFGIVASEGRVAGGWGGWRNEGFGKGVEVVEGEGDSFFVEACDWSGRDWRGTELDDKSLTRPILQH